MEHTRWIERTFSFEFPVTHLPLFMERLRGSHPRLAAITRDLDDATLSRRSGGWSLKEHIGHLADLDELHESRIDDYINRQPVLHAADMSNRKTEEARHNDRPVSELLAAFEKERNRFIRRLEALDDDMFSRSSMHPRLKVPMRLVDMVFFVAEHDDHHLMLMRKLLASHPA